MTPLLWLAAVVIAQFLLVIAAARTRAALSGKPPTAWWIRVLQAGMALVATLFLFAILVPTGHPRNFESHVMGDLRSFASAQIAFHSAASVYGKPECLARPRDCGLLMDSGITFVSEQDIGPDHDRRMQYRFTFYPGAVATGPPGEMLPTGMKGYSEWAYVAVPSTKRTSGFRSFCVDASGAIWFATPPQTIVAVKGRCPEGLQQVR
jgi:hypothetical protein